jgi:hypothetical protein
MTKPIPICQNCHDDLHETSVIKGKSNPKYVYRCGECLALYLVSFTADGQVNYESYDYS